MKPNKLTPGYNLMWESSRMMLPEHKQVLRAHQKELKKQAKPILDEQQIILFSEQIVEARYFEKTIKIKVFDPYQTLYVIGKVMKVDELEQRIKLVTIDGISWVSLDEILDLTIENNNIE
ncbi:YolD-like family protein [Paraliobacillus sediminis]|uniref:YolD-like family protein n=1 Tax=Paraliobacillus sediminis TaxID=1885916 RepID=UPI000E3DBD6C|nr:YolD-like family protein [Paraliobacillus sediminis]